MGTGTGRYGRIAAAAVLTAALGLGLSGTAHADPAGGARIFVADNARGAVAEIDADGTATERAGELVGPAGVALGAGRLYIADTAGPRPGIVSTDLTGADRRTVSDEITPYDLAVSGDRLIASDWAKADFGLVTMGLGGEDRRTLVSGLEEHEGELVLPAGVTTAGRTVYFTDLYADRILRVGRDGSGLATVVGEGLSSPTGIAARRGALVVADTAGDRVVRVDPVTGRVDELLTAADGISLPGDVAVHGDRLYVTSHSPDGRSGALVRAGLDGSDPVQIAELGRPNGIAIWSPTPDFPGADLLCAGVLEEVCALAAGSLG